MGVVSKLFGCCFWTSKHFKSKHSVAETALKRFFAAQKSKFRVDILFPMKSQYLTIFPNFWFEKSFSGIFERTGYSLFCGLKKWVGWIFITNYLLIDQTKGVKLKIWLHSVIVGIFGSKKYFSGAVESRLYFSRSSLSMVKFFNI